MDLRSIINTESGDSSINKQPKLVTPVKEASIEDLSGYKYSIRASPDKNIFPDYGLQRPDIPLATTYQHNPQYRRRPSLPIIVSPSNDLRSTGQTTSATSPRKAALPSTTSHFPYLHGQQTPESPAQSYQYMAEVQKREDSQYSNPSHKIENQFTYSQSPPPQSPKTSTQNSTPDSQSVLSKTPISHSNPIRLLNEKHQKLKFEERNRSTSSSPETLSSILQKQDLSSDSEREKLNISNSRMDTALNSPMLDLGSNKTSNKQSVFKKTSLQIHEDTHPPLISAQTAKKRNHYSEPPIWARSVKTHGHVIVAHQNSAHLKGKQTEVEATSAEALLRAKTNGNITISMHNNANVIDSHPSVILGSWEESITGKKPVEHITKVVADFLYLHVVSRSDLGELSAKGVQIEIEAKLGELIDKDTNQRFFLPVRSECILADNLRVGFKSSMTEKQHQRLNEFLNEMVTNTRQNNPNAKSRVRIDYLHRREVDKFYDIPRAMQAALPAAIREQISSHHPAKLRVTHDQKSKKVLARIIKSRVVSLDIHSGLFGTLDCRISVNLEMPFNNEFDEVIASGKISNQSSDRNKDRLSYTQSCYQIDLTQVTQNVSVNNDLRMEKEHELEIEISTSAVMDQGRRAARGDLNEFVPLVEGFLNNVRVLSRFVNDIK
ncbi:mRNA-capping enzyme subunit beta [Erysiphe neolycopersici]|uniref:mRNA-capping enzyme subunit beta n=1 Tax=Erysiphe neolycopersici TaxID=212602 RepID=A0A420HYS1_9PEZI|nr:mRNA-capping enzyme subunit beta [Erysiphe neolycopersici]